MNKIKKETDKNREELQKELQKLKEERESNAAATTIFGLGIERKGLFTSKMQ